MTTFRTKPPYSPSAVQVWAIEDHALQLTWGWLPDGPVCIVARRTDGSGRGAPLASVELVHHNGAGVAEVAGLPGNTAIDITVSWRGGTTVLRTATLPSLPGPELFRFATVSDLHLGAGNWGFLKTMTDPEAAAHADPYPLRCARGAISEAIEWGAELLVIKGDLVQHQEEQHFAQAGVLLDEFPDLPMLLIPGNHDVDRSPADTPSHEVVLPTIGRRELAYTTDAIAHDVPGLRIVVGDTTLAGQGHGTIQRVGPDILDLVAEPTPAFIAVHHHVHRFGVVTHWPPGIAKPEAVDFFARLKQANPQTIMTSGHSHRNRRRLQDSVTFSEVGSTKDWPGVWGGYVVHEGGVRQVVRRVRSTAAWHEYSRGAVLGLWSAWSPGQFHDRSFNLVWDPGRPPDRRPPRLRPGGEALHATGAPAGRNIFEESDRRHR